MKGLNPNMDQGIDIRLCPGSIPMNMLDCMPSEDIDLDSELEGYDPDKDEDVKVLNGVVHIVEHYAVPAWVTADNELIAIKDMETSHIKNCIRMIYRKNGTWRQQYLRYFKAELLRRKLQNSEPF